MLPSDVATEISTNPPTSAEEAEGILQRILSALATLEEPQSPVPSSLIWTCLNYGVHPSDSKEEWILGLCLIGSLLNRNESWLSPFEVHNIATQASVFCESQVVGLYATTCILLCCYALSKCPPRVTSRPKRWRSSVFETVRLCQVLLHSLDLQTLVDNVIPACTFVRNALPEGTERLDWVAAFEASIVQMTSFYAIKILHESNPDERLESMEYLCKGIEHATGGKFDTILHARYFLPNETDSQQMSHAKWIKVYMVGKAQEEDYEALASVQTEINEVGLAELSFFWFNWSGRPQLFSGSRLWHLLFPSVAILLNADFSVDSQAHGFLLLQRILSLIPETSLGTPSPKRPDYPLGTFQLLSNRIIADVASKEKNLLLPNGSQAFHLMKELLSKYPQRDQTHFVKQLHAQCPHQGLKPKILDLLRDFVNWGDANSLGVVWSFLNTRLEVLEYYCQTRPESAQFGNVDNLVSESEDFVAVMGLLRRWYMARETKPSIPDLHSRLLIVAQAVSDIMSKHQSLDIFRLGLLENSIQLVLDGYEKESMDLG